MLVVIDVHALLALVDVCISTPECGFRFYTGEISMSRLCASTSSSFRKCFFSLLPAAVFFCLAQLSDAFIRSAHPSCIAPIATATTTAISNTKLFNAAYALIRKAKLKEVDKLREAVNAEGSSHYINKFLETKQFVDLYGGPIPFVENVLNRYTSVTIMPEYSKKAKTGFILGLPEPEIMGVMFRDAGARSS